MSGTTNNLFAVTFADADNGYAVGTGRILRTTNGGLSWVLQQPGVTTDLYGVSFSDSDKGTAVGQSGRILRTTNGGFPTSVDESGLPPLTFQLKQNYPNPFNPGTTFQFQVPRTSHVTITISDVTGKKILDLFDGEVSPGVHSVFWNPDRVASGTYIYRIEANGYVESRKLVLLK